MLSYHIRSLGQTEALATQIAEALTRAGAPPSAAGDAAPRGQSCVAVFEPSDRGALDQVKSCSELGRRRVLGVTAGAAPLRAHETLSLLHAGCTEVLAWDGSERSVGRARALLERWHAVEQVLESPLVAQNLVGSSPAWLKVLRESIEVARFTSASVLILGESGTGKELLARLIHALDARPTKGQLLVLDCATVVPELSGSEFFGHERGAFTGAADSRDGAFKLAHGGTLFLDEVGELRPPLQAQLLRVIQEGTFKRLGSNAWHKTDFRLICATHRDLTGGVATGEFRQDFYHRIATWVCRLPSLRERPEDIPRLAASFARQLRPAAALDFDDAAREYLLGRAYPGNVRELRQLVCRMVQRHVGPGPITMGSIPEEARTWHGEQDWPDAELELSVRRALAKGIALKQLGRRVEELAVRIAVADAEGSLQGAALRLGVSDRALQLRRANQRG